MKNSDKKLIFVAILSLSFTVSFLVVASEAEQRDPKLFGAVFMFIIGLINSYGMLFNGYVIGTLGSSKNSKDDKHGMRNIWGIMGAVLIPVSFWLLFS